VKSILLVLLKTIKVGKLIARNGIILRRIATSDIIFFQAITPELDLEQSGLPELSLDFKRVFGIDAESLYYQVTNSIAKRRSILVSPYLEHFSTRYHFFHQRVALPSPIMSVREG